MTEPNFPSVEVDPRAVEAFEYELDRVLSSAPSDEDVEDVRDPLLLPSVYL